MAAQIKSRLGVQTLARHLSVTLLHASSCASEWSIPSHTLSSASITLSPLLAHSFRVCVGGGGIRFGAPPDLLSLGNCAAGVNDGEIVGFGLADDDDDDAAPGPSPARASSDALLHPTTEHGGVCAPLQLSSIDEVVTEEFVEQQVSGGGGFFAIWGEGGWVCSPRSSSSSR